MKIRRLILPVFTVLILLSGKAISQDLTAKEIIEKADEKQRGKSSRSEMTMTIVRPAWERSISMKSWSLGTEFMMIYITAPAKEKGQVYLKRHDEIWNWIPSINRLIKLPPSMMMQSWMGSDFTNDDLVKQSSIVTDYHHELMGTETVRDKECYKIKLTPKEDAPVVWGKIITWITKGGFNQWKAMYYNEDGELENIENLANIRDVGDRSIPTKIVVEPVDDEGNKTILNFESIEYNIDISEDFFSQQNMKRVH